MSVHHLDQYATVPSPVTRLAPAARVLVVVVVAVGAAVLPDRAWWAMAVLAAGVAALAAAARIPAGVFLRRLAAPLAFVLLVSVALLVLVPGRPVAELGPLRITDEGLRRVGSALGRAIPALGAAVLLVSTTRFPDLLEALRELRLPAAVTAPLGLAYRFVYVLGDEIERLRRAARSRNAGAGAAGRRRLAVGLAAAILQRALARSERVHAAMVARGYAGRVPGLATRPLDGRSLAVAVGAAGLVAVVVTMAWVSA